MRDFTERFWTKVNKSLDCWNWLANKYPNGYGQFQLEGKPRSAHRLSYELAYGPIPKGLVVRHKCDNPGCVRPEHLELGTQADNVQDSVRRSRNANSIKTECKHNHPFDSDNTYITSEGKRQCKACRKIRKAKYHGQLD